MSEKNIILRAQMYAWDAMSADEGDIQSGTVAAADAAISVVLADLRHWSKGQNGPTIWALCRKLDELEEAIGV